MRKPAYMLGFLWSRRQESNPQPTVYKTVALPLSYVGLIGLIRDYRLRRSPQSSAPTYHLVQRDRCGDCGIQRLDFAEER